MSSTVIERVAMTLSYRSASATGATPRPVIPCGQASKRRHHVIRRELNGSFASARSLFLAMDDALAGPSVLALQSE